MNHSPHVTHLFSELIADELSEELRQYVRSHLDECAKCRSEWDRLSGFMEASQALLIKAETEAAAIDWDDSARRILSRIRERKTEKVRTPARSWTRRPVFSGAAALFVIAILGFFALKMPRSRSIDLREQLLIGESIERLETDLHRGQILEYLDRSRLVLTDIMKQCQSHPPDPLELAQQSQQVQTLLRQKNYFATGLTPLELAKAEPVCRKIDFLFMELTQIDADNHCRDLERIQGMIRQENLLLKIRLLESDLSEVSTFKV